MILASAASLENVEVILVHKKKLLVCPKCYAFYSVKQSSLGYSCNDCNGELQLVSFDHDVYMTFSDEEKTAFKKKYIEDHFLNYVPPFQPLPQSGWIGYISGCGWLALVACIIGCFISFMSGSIVYAFILALVGALSCGSLILFSIVAEDVRHIRNQIDKLHHDQKYKN